MLMNGNISEFVDKSLVAISVLLGSES